MSEGYVDDIDVNPNQITNVSAGANFRKKKSKSFKLSIQIAVDSTILINVFLFI